MKKYVSTICLIVANGLMDQGVADTKGYNVDPAPVHISHGLARFDDLKYPRSFNHFDYVNPNAPNGGEIHTVAIGSFDSLNPYAQTGITPLDTPPISYFHLGFLNLNEPLMVGSGEYAPMGDELHSAYGLIAESIEYPDDNRWIVFNLRPEATFHDGHLVTAKDVLFSYQQLKQFGREKYQLKLKPISSVDILGKHKVRFNFSSPGQRSQLFRAAELPVLPAHYWQNKELNKPTHTPPLNSGPYQISQVVPGSSITLTRVKNYWGKNLPVNKGKYNLDKITLHFYRDITIAFESFKSGEHDIYIEPTAKNWATGYQFPAVEKGLIKKIEIPSQTVVGSPMLVFNTRRNPFNDKSVREALGYLLDFEWTNKMVFHNAYTRAASYFPNSTYAAKGLPSKEELALLNPWRKQLPAQLFKAPFHPPVTSGDGVIRNNQQKALELLKSSGWKLQGKRLINTEGKPLAFELLSYTHLADRLIIPFKKNLASIGIEMSYRIVDSTTYFQRIRNLDFDAAGYSHMFGLSIGDELFRFFHSQNANIADTKNLAGIQNPVVDKLIEMLPNVKSQKELETLTRSLDRVLLWNHYGIPLFYYNKIRVAYRDIYQWPAYTPPLPMLLSTWWIKQ